jgi:NAD(P)-dependent dehydrogenase (short-subunit alcohol dehydrogenase family)
MPMTQPVSSGTGGTAVTEWVKNTFGLAERACVVTGGASGIGRGIALLLGQEGAKVAVLDRDGAGAQETVGLIVAAGGTGLAATCDVSDQANVESACAKVRQRFGDAHVLVNNAGFIRKGAIETLPLADWNGLLSVNLTGYFLCAQTFGRGMLANGDGVIVNVSSVMADYASPLGGAYSVAKAGVAMLSRLLAVEWGPKGVRSNCVQPALVITPLSQPIYDQPEFMQKRSAAVPSRRIGLPEDIARTVLFLASPHASYVNGTDLMVDGGFVANLMNLIPRHTPEE